MDLVVFDLDGVLLDSRDAHYRCLNDALETISPKYIINPEEHHTLFDGKPTLTKLKMLSQMKGLDPECYQAIYDRKQLLTMQYIRTNVTRDEELQEMMRYLKEEHNSQIACASNSIYETIKLSLLHLGLTEYVDYFLSNEDVKNPKPHPEIYFKCMIRSNRAPKEVTIVEDSVVGLQAATRSGANVIKVNNRCDVNKKLFIPKARCTSWR
jgi:HAD superfamily hydrolase (TIGR01509 family)